MNQLNHLFLNNLKNQQNKPNSIQIESSSDLDENIVDSSNNIENIKYKTKELNVQLILVRPYNLCDLYNIFYENP